MRGVCAMTRPTAPDELPGQAQSDGAPLHIRAAHAEDHAALSAIARAAKARWGYAGTVLARWQAALTVSPASIAPPGRPSWPSATVHPWASASRVSKAHPQNSNTCG
jgi:hypothetical protein